MSTHTNIPLHYPHQLDHYLVSFIMKHPNAWLIKDKDSNYLFANESLLNLYNIRRDIIGENEADILPNASRLIKHSSQLDALTRLNMNSVFSIEVNNFFGHSQLSPRVYIRRPFSYVNDDTCVLIEIAELSSINFSLPLMDTRLIPYFNPLNTLTKREWEIGWLILSGYTHLEVADILSLSKDYIDKRMRGVYRKLGIHGQNDFLKAGHVYQLVKYIPQSLMNSPYIYKINNNE